MSNNIQDAYDSVRKFNSIAGNLQAVTPHSIAAQIDFITEERNETFDAVLQGDAIELLDGACDLFVTVAGLMQKLDAAGFDVEEALKRVCENNLSKFPVINDYTHEGIRPEGSEDTVSECGHVVFKRNSDGKVMKPTNFVPVNINALAPGDFFA
jgi:NTP pyrophosphatase (non-canonical NTP hydrolase)